MKSGFESNIRKMYLVRLLFNMYFISAVIVPFYIEWGGIKFSQILFLNAWFMFWNFLLEIPTGTVADFLGRKVSIILGCISAIIGIMVYVSYPNFIIFLAAEVIFGVSYTLLSGADEALIYDSLKKIDRTHLSKKVFSRMESFKLAGIVVGAVTGSFIAKKYGLRMTLALQAVPIAIAVFLSFSFKEPPVWEKKPALSFYSYKKILTDGVRFFLETRILKLLTMDMVVINAFAWIIIWFYQALLKNAGVDMAYFGIVHAAMTLAEIFIINNFIRFERWLGAKKRLLFFSAFLTGISFIILGITRFTPLVIAAIIVCAGSGLTRGPLFSSYMNKYIPSDKRATVLSTTSMLRTFSIVVVNTVAGLLADWSIPNTLLILGMATILFAFLSRIKEEHLID
ncbi:MAG TPA: MFS transporter [Candidatus Deferrimicrobium sp.]|nr:MFS transporter [Candidatus Deferrimicrobium sp.]